VVAMVSEITPGPARLWGFTRHTCRACADQHGLHQQEHVLQHAPCVRTGEAVAHLAGHAVARALPRLRARQQLLLCCAIHLQLQGSTAVCLACYAVSHCTQLRAGPSLAKAAYAPSIPAPKQAGNCAHLPIHLLTAALAVHLRHLVLRSARLIPPAFQHDITYIW
jgi:hypothetical protein